MRELHPSKREARARFVHLAAPRALARRYSIETLTNAWSAEDGARLGGADEMITQLSPVAWVVSSQPEFDRTVSLASYTRKGLYGVVGEGTSATVYVAKVIYDSFTSTLGP